MSGQRYDIIDVAEEMSKGAYNLGYFVLNGFCKVTNLEALKQSYDAYQISRFSQTIEDFQFEHDKLSENEKRDFYKDLKYNEQNLHYLHSLFNKSRESIFLIHMKILSKLSAELIKNKDLNYFQSTLLANINILNEDDITYIAYLFHIIKAHKSCSSNGRDMKLSLIHRTRQRRLFENRTKSGYTFTFSIFEYSHYYTYQKCLQLGIFIKAPMKQDESPYGVITNIRELEPLDNREIQITENTVDFINLLKEIFLDTNE